MGRHGVGLQLYTLRDECADDFFGTLRKVADLGYQGVEFAGFYGYSAREVKQMIDEVGLQPVSSHVALHSLRGEELQKTIDFHKEIGCDYIVCPWVDPQLLADTDQARALISELAAIGEHCKKQHVRFGYHNHDFELAHRIDGEAVLHVLYRETDPSVVLAELDLYWIRKGGEDEVAAIRRYAGRVPVVHLKDMEKGEEGFFTEVGTGRLDLNAIFAAGEASGVEWYIVEQDVCRDHSPLVSVKISIDHLKEQGFLK
ncbi:sugar phosphate isomerase/epimerase family protein [Lihuaxuella thermophila]|uniref:Sugar phosphate isomerase/epimerase n=1 Tax=Lihuaxuella thermophila TaxID=1173111 RepID=A0A1H8FEE4_9BACL|nr:sugar phosphate isomerase/epimerase [Lihuaxuella thermophila]SEN30042.1 Sugar phosphate isomerase/epimerase [Lihuaxuella thermophila]